MFIPKYCDYIICLIEFRSVYYRSKTIQIGYTNHHITMYGKLSYHGKPFKFLFSPVFSLYSETNVCCHDNYQSLSNYSIH